MTVSEPNTLHAPPAAPPQPVPPDTGKGRVLVVDDDETNRDLLSRRLIRAGYTVELADSGPAALARIAGGGLDLVLLDVQMPGMSGLEALAELRLTQPSAQLAVIMATAKAQSEDVVEALDLGADDYVTKPIDLPVLLARMRTQLARLSAERRVRDREEQFALAVRGANDGLWDWKVRSGDVYFSPRWKEMLGYADEELENRMDAWYERMHPDDRPRVWQELHAHLRGDTTHFESEHRLMTRSGHYLWVRSRAAAVRNALGEPERVAGSLTDITSTKAADPLTRLANRVLFVDRVERAMEYARRDPEWHYAVLLIDLDRFKLVNDSVGRTVGDQLLVLVGRHIEQSLRETDTVARIGLEPSAESARTVARLEGDEFAVLLTGLRGPQEACTVADRIQGSFSEPFHVETHTIFSSVSIGVAMGSSDYGRADEVLSDADTAMYHAKTAGRARVEVYHSGLRQRAVARLQTENDLRTAVDEGQFVLHYQPIICLETGVVRTFEALVRWNHPTEGLLGPARFIEVAEDTGLIIELGDWVLREACRQLREWDQTTPGAVEVSVAVNLSAKQLAAGDIVERVDRVLREYRVNPARIELELTESSVVADHMTAKHTLERLRALGVRLSIDDFGTGYSSLGYLKEFPVDTLKIDRSFIAESTNRPSHARVLATIVSLASQLGLDVVAEGVETTEQADYLRSLSCALGQGYLFSRPVSQAEAGRLIQSMGTARHMTEGRATTAP